MSHPDRPENPPPPSDALGASGAPAVADPSAQSTHIATPNSGEPGAPTTWGHLHLLGEIGRGAYGRVYRAWDPALAREIALKVTPVKSGSDTAAELLREGRLLARVRDKNVVTVYGAQQIGSEIGVWMELVRGRSLSHMVRDDGPMAAEEAAVIGISLCHALTAVHTAGLVHRDLKAQNVMRESGGRILLMDFGAGRDQAAMEHGWDEMAGTPLYMPPEVLAGRPWTPAGDVYCLGVLLFFLVTGRYPIEGRTLTEIVVAHGRGQHQLLQDCRPDLPEGFVRVVERALAPVERRYRTAGALMRDLADAIPGTSGSWPGDLIAEQAAAARGAFGSQARWVSWAAGGAAAVASVWLLGFLATSAFDTSLGRTAAFTHETAIDWLIWGLRSLAGPALYMAMAVLVYRLLRVVWTILVSFVAPIRRLAERMRAAVAQAAATVGLDDRNTRAQWVLAGQVAFLLVIIWLSYDLLYAAAGFTTWARPEDLWPLRPESAAPVYYRMRLSILLLVSGVAWYRVLKAGPGGTPVDRATVAAGLALIAIVVMLLEVPFRIISLNQFERVNLSGERCYITGESDTRILLYCPDGPRRIRVVGASEPMRDRFAVQENLFTPPSDHPN